MYGNDTLKLPALSKREVKCLSLSAMLSLHWKPRIARRAVDKYESCGEGLQSSDKEIIASGKDNVFDDMPERIYESEDENEVPVAKIGTNIAIGEIPTAQEQTSLQANLRRSSRKASPFTQFKPASKLQDGTMKETSTAKTVVKAPTPGVVAGKRKMRETTTPPVPELTLIYVEDILVGHPPDQIKPRRNGRARRSRTSSRSNSSGTSACAYPLVSNYI